MGKKSKVTKMTDSATTIGEIYAGINPLPAMLLKKGKKNPSAEFRIEANAGVAILMKATKRHATSEWEMDYNHFFGDSFNDALSKAVEFINKLPAAEQAKLHDFMGALGKLIDAGKADGISVDYMNPLLDTMKRLSENVITYQPKKSRS